MEIEIILIFLGCIIGCSIQSYNSGVRAGATGMIDSLIMGGNTDPKTGVCTITVDVELEDG
jgi:hypothetical protein|tara:strand:+ start:1879 stop:2061 length:183 start_codon:yes stop_codon:yes gene_type:complete